MPQVGSRTYFSAQAARLPHCMKAAFPYSQELMQCHAVTPCCHWTHLQRNPFLDPSSVRFFNTENIQDSWNWAKTISRYPNARHWPQSLGYLQRNLDPPILLLPVSSTEALPWSGHPKHLVSDSARKKQKTSFPPLLNFLDAFREPWGKRWSQHTKSLGGEWWTQGWLCKCDAVAPGT